MKREIGCGQDIAYLQAKVDTLAVELERTREAMVAYREIFNLTSQMGPVQLMKELRR